MKYTLGKYKFTQKQWVGREKYEGSLELSSLTSIPEGFNQSIFERKKIGLLSWQGGKYILADGIFTEVISKRGNVYKVKKISSDEVFYLVTDGNSKFAHGETIQEAKKDLIYKLAGDVDIEQFKGLTLESMLGFEDCIKLYRVVTGACAFGVKDFIESTGTEHRSYTVREIIEKTSGRYGHDRLVSFVTGKVS